MEGQGATRLSRGTAAAGEARPPHHVAVRGVTRIYPATPAIHALGPVDLDLARGEFFSVVGPSGCGKSTLLDVIAGLSAPTEGTISFEGRPLRGRVPEGIGAVFQEDASFPWLSVGENIAFGLKRSGSSPGSIREKVDYALSFMGLKDFRDAYPSQLSGGMRQRMCIARTLVMEPRLILLDEPFGALDQQTRLLMGDELLRMWRAAGATILLITHSLDEAVMLSDRIGVMSARPGRIIETIATGWPRERSSLVLSDAAFGSITGRLWSLLREESIKAIGLQSKEP
jgi:NitT/TauT family transport system ATP-binding protein